MRLVLAALIFLFGCCTCPPQDLYFMGESGTGRYSIIGIEKGYFDNKEHWMTEEEMEQQFQMFLDGMDFQEQTSISLKFLRRER